MKPLDRSSRLDSIDLLRGLVMVVMALDHVRGNFWNGGDPHIGDMTNPSDPNLTGLVFLTRWITHFCAPTFVLLAGTGAFLFGARRQSKSQLAWFLLSRGIWLVLLEFTIIRYSWQLEWTYHWSFGQVIWVLGLSMMAMSGLIYLPLSAIVAGGVALIGLHNAFDGVTAEQFGDYAWVWKILHTGKDITINSEFLHLENATFAPFYPLIPWIGVMMVGYGLGGIMTLESAERRRQLLGLGLTLIATFFVLRYWNFYGDKPAERFGASGRPWSEQRNTLFTIFSFVNCHKYPPSLCFLLMTLGPAITALALFEYVPEKFGKPLVILGRVPMFFYLLHWYLIKGLAVSIAYFRFGRFDWLYGPLPRPKPPSNDGFDLWVVYLIWLLIVALLFPLCWWYAGVKRRSKSVWLSYI